METDLKFPDEASPAWRRHHVVRLKRRRALYWGFGARYGLDLPCMSPRQLGLIVGTPKPCSLLCCGNPRRWLGERTVQESRWHQRYAEE